MPYEYPVSRAGWLASVMLVACSATHPSPARPDAEPADGAFGASCPLPISAPFEQRGEHLKVAFFHRPDTGACQLRCAGEDCERVDSSWLHVATFEGIERTVSTGVGHGPFTEVSDGRTNGPGDWLRAPGLAAVRAQLQSGAQIHFRFTADGVRIEEWDPSVAP